MILQCVYTIYKVIFSYLTFHVPFAYFTLLLGDYGLKLRQRSFGRFMKSIGPLYERGAGEIKEKHFSSLNNEATPLTILEIGIGAGANFKYYPKSRHCELVAVDYDGNYETSLAKNLEPYKNIHMKSFYKASAEDMSVIEDGSVDIVISTEALCSIPTPKKAIQEIFRVLKPGGKYYFLEHTLDESGSFLRKLQDFLLWCGIWQFLFMGCKFFTDPSSLRECNFSNVQTTNVNFNLPYESIPLQIATPHVYGVATK